MPVVKKQTIKTPTKKNVIPPDYDVILPGMGYTKPTKKSPPKKIKKKQGQQWHTPNQN